MTTPIRIAVTGAAGQIGYSLIFRIAAGEAFGRDHSTVIHAFNLIQRRVTNDSAFRFSIEKIERELKNVQAPMVPASV